MSARGAWALLICLWLLGAVWFITKAYECLMG